jgi:alkylation response protein AidB-like acyl-CoA dehydrogenase
MSLNSRDVRFQVFEVLQAESLLSRTRFAEHSLETFDGVLDMAFEFARHELAPHYRLSDTVEPHVENGVARTLPEVKQALEGMREAGFFAAAADEAFGGLQLPNLVWNACQAAFMATNPGTASYAFLTVGAANLISSFGSDAQKETYLRPMLEGRWFGTMCLSEPHAGSSLTDIYTRATPRDDGKFLLSGSKMWISGGDQDISENIVHMVLAKLPDAPAGVKGISLFIAPKKRVAANGALEGNDVALAGLNHKLGARGTTNALLSFGEHEDCVAELIGEPHKGLGYMFQMMNEARIGVGLGGAALGCAGFQHSLEYARERRQGRLPTSKDPLSPMVAIIEHSDVKRMLLTQKALAEGAFALCMYASRLVDDHATHPDETARNEAGALLDLLTPIVKAWSTHYALEANYQAIQILGGYGYTREYAAEQIYRDNRINPIHEGTNGIQSLDLLGRKVGANGSAALKLLAVRIGADITRARDAGLDDLSDALENAVNVVHTTTAKLFSAASDPDRMLANSWHYLEMLGHTVVAWQWLNAARVAKAGLERHPTGTDEAFYQGKLHAARYFTRFELPKVAVWGNLLGSLDTTTLEMHDEWF